MAETIVDRFKTIEIDEDDGEAARGVAFGLCERAPQTFDEEGAVRQLRQLVVKSLTFDRFVGALARGDVARDLDESAGATVGCGPQARHVTAGKEAHAIAADVPAFVERLSIARRRGEFEGGDAAVDGFARIDQGEVFADDVGFAIAEDDLGPGIPEFDDARAIDREDRVVGNALDQEPQVMVVGVANHLRKSDDDVGVVEQRLHGVGAPKTAPVLAHVPAIDGGLPVRARSEQLGLRAAVRDVFLRKN